MTTVPLRHVADVNPATPEFDRLGPDDEVTFMPLETVWADDRVDFTRRVAKAAVATGYTRFRDGDVLVPKVTPTFQAGRTAVARLATAAGAGTTELHVIRARASVSDSRFIAYVCRSKPFLDEGVSAFQGVAGLQRVPDEYLRSFPVAELPLEEQRRIADFLDAETARLHALVDLRSRQLDALGEQYRSALQDLYVCQPTPDILEARAGSSDTRPLRYLLSRTISGRTPDAGLVDDGPVPWLAIGDLIDGGEVQAGSRSFSASTLAELGMAQAPAGAVVLAMYASLGKVATLVKPSVFNQAIIGLVPRPNVPAAYLVGWLELAQPSLPALARTATQPNLNAEQVRALRFPLHEPREMADIAANRAELRSRLCLTSLAIDRAQQLVTERRQALITAAVTGQLDVTTARGGHS